MDCSDDLIVACPECDSGSVKRNVCTDLQGPNRDDVSRFQCEDCGHKFKEFEAVRRERKVEVLPRKDSVARTLHDADPNDLVTDGGSGQDENAERGNLSEDGIERERRGPQLVSPLTSRQKSASPQVHSAAIPIGFIVPSDLSVAENKAPQERHFAKHRGAESGFDIAVLVILSQITDGCCDFKGNWIGGGNQSLFIDIEDDSASGSKKTIPSPGLAHPTTDRDHTEMCYGIAGLYGTLLSHGFARFGAGRQYADGRCQQWLCRPLEKFVNRKIAVLASITSTGLAFTGTGFPHLISSRHHLYTENDSETTISSWLGPATVVIYFQGSTRLNSRAVNTDTDQSGGAR